MSMYYLLHGVFTNRSLWAGQYGKNYIYGAKKNPQYL